MSFDTNSADSINSLDSMDSMDSIKKVNKIYSVKEVNLIVKNIIKENFDNDIIVEGEISNFKISKGNLFLTLKDDMSKISVIFWRYDNYKNDDICDGTKVKVTGRLTVWDKQGSYQLTANKIEKCGTGDLHLKYLKIKEKYEKLGYFDEKNKKKLVKNIKNIGLITALKGAAIKDFIYVLEKNGFSGNLKVKGSYVQGNNCPTSISKNIKELDKMNLDVIVITRGGGSYEDLFGFNDPKILKAIYKAKTCIISAIGHEIDTMLSDYVADIRAPTPSVAGEILALHQKKEYDISEFLNFKKSLHSKLSKELFEYKYKLQKYDKIVQIPNNIIDNIISNLNKIKLKSQIKLRNELDMYKSKIMNYKNIVKNMNPNNILKNGYTILLDKNDNMIKSKLELENLFNYKNNKNNRKNKKLKFKLKFIDGDIDVEITNK